MISMSDRAFHPTLSKPEKMELWQRMGGPLFDYPKADFLKSFRKFARANVAYEYCVNVAMELRKKEKKDKTEAKAKAKAK